MTMTAGTSDMLDLDEVPLDQPFTVRALIAELQKLNPDLLLSQTHRTGLRSHQVHHLSAVDVTGQMYFGFTSADFTISTDTAPWIDAEENAEWWRPADTHQPIDRLEEAIADAPDRRSAAW